MGIGLALSGGGVRGAVHIGVLKALEENRIYPNYISGTSAGSIVAGLYSSGYKADEIEQIFRKYAGRIIIDFDIGEIYSYVMSLFMKKPKNIDGFIKGNRIKELIDKYCSEKGCKYIKDAKIPVAIPAVDINSAKTIMFISSRQGLNEKSDIEYDDHIDLATAVRASSSYPVIFKPCMVKGKRLVDGGIKNNIPVKVLKDMGAKKVLAVNLGYVGKANEGVDNLLEIAVQSVDIMAHQISKWLVKDANYVILPEVYDVKLLEVSRIPECIERGYQAAIASMPEIKRALYY